MGSILSGLSAFPRAFALLARNRRILRLAIIPFAINVVLFAVGIPLSIWGAVRLVGWMFGESSGWLAALAILFEIVAALAVVVAGVFLFTLIGSIVASPFNGPLAAAVEAHEVTRRGLPASSLPARSLLADVTRGVVFQIGRLLLFLVLYLCTFVLQLIPGVGTLLHLVVTYVYVVFVLSVDFSDPVLDRRYDRFRDKLRYVWDRRGTYLGFGTGALLLMLVPLLNLLVLPVCVVAATILYVDDVQSSAPIR